MAEVAFTAGITLQDDRMLSVDVTSVDAGGLGYDAGDGPITVPWADVKAVMLATTDHMLETGGSLFRMAELLHDADQGRAGDAAQMRRFGAHLLQQAAPRLCPLGEACGLRASP